MKSRGRSCGPRDLTRRVRIKREMEQGPFNLQPLHHWASWSSLGFFVVKIGFQVFSRFFLGEAYSRPF